MLPSVIGSIAFPSLSRPLSLMLAIPHRYREQERASQPGRVSRSRAAFSRFSSTRYVSLAR